MQWITVQRIQHPVGHGSFHTGRIDTYEPAPHGQSAARKIRSFTYVYDCGSECDKAFTSELAFHGAASGGHTDILFVSHLHADHINKIDRLQTIAPAKTVIVPYLDVFERLLIVLADMTNSRHSISGDHYFRDPINWWQRRGVERVIFLEAGNGDDSPPVRPAEPYVPTEGRTPDGEEGTRDARERTFSDNRLFRDLRPARGDGNLETDLLIVGTRLGDGEVSIAGPGSSIQLEWRGDTSEHWRQADWILLPYVHPIGDPARTSFRKQLRHLLGFEGNDPEDLTTILLEHLASKEKKRRLLDLYSDQFGHGHNAVSMSLYSGPFSKRPTSRFEVVRDDALRGLVNRNTAVTGHHRFHGPTGWLGTGDAELRQSRFRAPWKGFYDAYGDQIGVITLPHHGSDLNFHADILDFPGIDTALATTTEKQHRVARLRDTLNKVEARGIKTRVVDQKRENRFIVNFVMVAR